MKQGKFKIKLYKDNHGIRTFLDTNLIKSAPDLLQALKDLEMTSCHYVNGRANIENLEKYLASQKRALKVIKASEQ